MEAWHFWLIAALITFLIEIMTPGFAVICLSIGALGGMVASFITPSYSIQTIAFAAVTLLAFIFIRPIILRLFASKKEEHKSGVEALIGRKALVSEEIDWQKQSGRVHIDGDSWKAVAEDGGTIGVGETVIVLKVDSVILTVRRVSNPKN